MAGRVRARRDTTTAKVGTRYRALWGWTMFWGSALLVVGSVLWLSSLTEHHVTAVVVDPGTCGQQSGSPGGPNCDHQIRYTVGART